MDRRKMIVVMIASAGMMVWLTGGAAAEDQSTPVSSVQTLGADQGQASGETRKGYPGYRIRTLSETQQASKGKTNRITQIVEDERTQMKALAQDRSLTKEQRKEKARQIREEADTKLKAILPPEAWKKHEESRENARQMREALRMKNAEKSQQ